MSVFGIKHTLPETGTVQFDGYIAVALGIFISFSWGLKCFPQFR